jgi:outer membrane protease
LDFYENMAGGWFLNGGISVGYRIGTHAVLFFSTSYRRITGLIGDSYYIETGVGSSAGARSAPTPKGGGAAYDAVDASISFTVAL